jgi:ankyrin repeat protein
MRYKALSALQAAALGGHLHVVNRLLAAGADVNAEGCYYNGCTALYAAALEGHVHVVRRLLDVGSDRNMTAGNKHWTPFQAAFSMGHDEIAEILSRREPKTEGSPQNDAIQLAALSSQTSNLSIT